MLRFALRRLVNCGREESLPLSSLGNGAEDTRRMRSCVSLVPGPPREKKVDREHDLFLEKSLSDLEEIDLRLDEAVSHIPLPNNRKRMNSAERMAASGKGIFILFYFILFFIFIYFYFIFILFYF